MAQYSTPFYGGFSDVTAFDPLEWLRRRNLQKPTTPTTPITPTAPQPSTSGDDSFPDVGNVSGDGLLGYNQAQATQDYLKAREDYPTAYKLATMAVPGVGLLDNIAQVGMGINPLGDLTGVGNQTFSNYQGSTTSRGDPFSDRTLTRDQYSAALASYNQDKQAGMLDPNQDWASYYNEYTGKEQAKTTPTPLGYTFPSWSPDKVPAWRNNLEPSTANPPRTQPLGLVDKAIGLASNWSNPAASTDTSTLSGSTGTTNASITTNADGSLTFSSDETGDVSGTDYGGGYSGWDSGYEGGYTGGGDVNGGEIGYESPDGGDSGGDSGGGGGSYIATATTQALGENGLKVFEDWRDYMFNALPTFTATFGRYRATAPKIVEEINKKDNSKELYKEIWSKHLKPIYDLIKVDKDSKKALKDYKVMVRELTNKYLKG